MDPNSENTPEWPPPNPHRPASFIPMSDGSKAMPASAPPQPPGSASEFTQAPQPHAPVPLKTTASNKTVNTKLLVITGIIAGSIVILGTATALFWPKKQTLSPPPPPTHELASKYYYVDSVQNSTQPAGSYTYNIGFADLTTNTTAKQTLTVAHPLLQDNHLRSNNPLRFTGDGSRYAYAITDQSGLKDPSKATPDNYKIITGTWPQKTDSERVLYSETKRNDSRDWLLTQDGKELVYLDIVMDSRTATTSDLYSVDVATGKQTKIGAIDRPADRENSALYESTKDGSVRFYTEQDDGIYETRYDRLAHKLTNKKVVIRDYDPGNMGRPSPDGTKMVYYGIGKDDFTVYLLDLAEGGSTPLIATPAKYGSYDNGVWAPDSKTVALTANIKDIDGKHYENQMITIDTVVRSNENTIFLRNKSPGIDNSASSYTITSWSPDEKYITYIQNSRLYFYDIKNKRAVDDTFKITRDSNLATTFVEGWVSAPQKKLLQQ